MDTSYPTTLRRADRRRGRLDGEQRTPSLAEVRRRQQELRESGGQLSVGYQSVLLAELSEKLNELSLEYQQLRRVAAAEIARLDANVDRTDHKVNRMAERLRVAEAPLTAEELLPRNAEEQRWEERVVRNRREVARIRRIAGAGEAVEQARTDLERLRDERAAALRQHQEAATAPGIRARRLVELYQRRLAEYVSALAQYHPEGRTLHALLSIPDIQLPEWATETPDHPDDPRSAG